MKTEDDRRKQKKYHFRIGAFFAIGLFIAVCSFGLCIFRLSYGDIPEKNLFGIAFEFSAIMVCTVFLGGCYYGIDNNMDVIMRFSALLIVMIVDFYMDQIIWCVDGLPAPTFVFFNYFCNSMYYLTNVLAIVAFVKYMCEILPNKVRYEKIYTNILWGFVIVLVVVLILNLKYEFLFSITDGVYHREFLVPYEFSCVGAFLLGIIPFMFRQPLDLVENYVILSYVLMPFICTILQYFFYGIPFSPIGMFLSMCILYVHGHVRKGRIFRQQQIELQDQRTAIMLSQIRPHFLYNALTSVAMLCSTDPELARKTTINFTRYLRANISSLSSDKPIPFEHELNHTRAYLEIEMVRFADRLRVEYDIETTDFTIPALTVQPLAENAVKHGICKNENGGTVKISVKETEKTYVVEVGDDGIGFDMDSIDWISGNHVGITNVTRRLQTQQNASLEINSVPGEGTVSRIIICKMPVGKNNNNK